MKTRKNLDYTELQNMTTAELKREARKLENSIRRQYNRLKGAGFNPMFKPLNIKDIDKSTQARKKYIAAIKKGQETMGLETYTKTGINKRNAKIAKDLGLKYEKPTKSRDARFMHQSKDEFGEFNTYIDKEEISNLLDAWSAYAASRDVYYQKAIYNNLVNYAIEGDWFGLSLEDTFDMIKKKARELSLATRKGIEIDFEDDMPY